MHNTKTETIENSKYVSTEIVKKEPFSPEMCGMFCLLTNQLIVTFRIDDLDVFCMNPCDDGIDGTRDRGREREGEKETRNDDIWMK